MIINDTIVCKNCGRIIEWHCKVSDDFLSSRYLIPEKIDPNKVYARPVEHNSGTYLMTCCCKNCDYENSFKYETKYRL